MTHSHVLLIGLASELLLGRYAVPPPRNPSSPLALHERGIFTEMQDILKSMGGKYRSEEFNRLLLPRSTALVQAIGHRMAYEAAISAGVHAPLVDLYEAGAIACDMGWYMESKVLGSRKEVLVKEEAAVTDAYNMLDALFAETGIQPYIQAPVVSAEAWQRWVERMPLLGKAKPTDEVDEYDGQDDDVSILLGEEMRAKL
jgi:acyl-CoA oxidase